MILVEYLDTLLALCADVFGVSVEDVRSRSRTQELVYCRKAFCILAKEMLDIKQQVVADRINRSAKAVGDFISDQPADKYYRICLSKIRASVKPFER